MTAVHGSCDNRFKPIREALESALGVSLPEPALAIPATP